MDGRWSRVKHRRALPDRPRSPNLQFRVTRRPAGGNESEVKARRAKASGGGHVCKKRELRNAEGDQRGAGGEFGEPADGGDGCGAEGLRRGEIGRRKSRGEVPRGGSGGD